MRKIFSTMMLVAAAAMAFVSCQKETAPSQVEEGYISFISENPASKTHWDGQTITWSDDDAIRVALMIGETWYQVANSAKLYQSNKLKSDAQTATFSVSGFTADVIAAGGWTGAYQFYGLYPASAEDANFGKTTSKASIEIPAEQALSSDTFDKSADILWGKAVQPYSELPSSDVSMVWNRVVAHAYISLNDIKGIVSGEIVKRVTFTAQSDADLTGGYELHMATGEFTPKSSATNKVVLVSNEGVVLSGDDLTLWACINPCTLTELDIEIDTDKAVYTIKKTGFSREFKANKRNILPIDMSTATRIENEVPETNSYYVKVTEVPADGDWSGQYILVYANGDSAEILTSEYSSSFFKVKNISLGDCGVLASDITEDCILTISEVTGGYNLRIGSSYISYGGSSTNLSSSTAVPTENNGIWTINLTSQGNATITNVGTTTRFLKYNTAASANRFAAYTSSTGKAVQLYKLQSN